MRVLLRVGEVTGWGRSNATGQKPHQTARAAGRQREPAGAEGQRGARRCQEAVEDRVFLCPDDKFPKYTFLAMGALCKLVCGAGFFPLSPDGCYGDPVKMAAIERDFRAHSKSQHNVGNCGALDGCDFKQKNPGKAVPNPNRYFVDRKNAFCLLCNAWKHSLWQR